MPFNKIMKVKNRRKCFDKKRGGKKEGLVPNVKLYICGSVVYIPDQQISLK